MRSTDRSLRRLLALVALSFACLVPTGAEDAKRVSPEQALSVDGADSPTPSARPIAVLPFTNRSSRTVPLEQIRASLVLRLKNRGLDLLGDEELAAFMRRHRMRNTSGLSSEMAQTLAEETGAWAALITTVDLYDEREPPKIALTSRLVSAESQPRILWMDGVDRVGDQAPGGFDLGLISDVDLLTEIALFDTAKALSEKPTAASRKPRWRFRPRSYYASTDFPIVRQRPSRIAVLPFVNDSATKYAGEILSDQLIRHLIEVGVDVIEPGVVRQVMLEARQFYAEGPSVPEIDILRLHLQADVVVFGEVSRYEEKLGLRPTRVEFLVRAVDTERGELIWASNSYASGEKGVYLWGAGRIHSAQALASEMARALVGTVIKERAKQARKR